MCSDSRFQRPREHHRLIKWVHIEERNFLDIFTSRISGNARDIEHTQTGLVVGLICKAIVNELVMVGGAGLGLVISGVHRFLEVPDIPDVSDRETVDSRRVRSNILRVDLTLIELVIHDEMRLPVQIKHLRWRLERCANLYHGVIITQPWCV